jgi:hypothetical protein
MSIKTEHSTGRNVDIDQATALVEKAQQLAGHFPSEEAMTRGRRILEGTLTEDEARAEIAAKWGFPLSDH